MSRYAHKRRENKEVYITIIPVLNLMLLLLPFLIYAVSLLQIAVIDSTLPALARDEDTKDENLENKEEPLNLTVAITEEGFIIGGSGGILGTVKAYQKEQEPPSNEEIYNKKRVTIPLKPDGEYDYELLGRILLEIKRKYPENSSINIKASPNIIYDIIIKVMDTSREIWIPSENPLIQTEKVTLFPNVIFVGEIR